MRWLGIFLITLYQKYLSPLKRFRCAYGALHGQGSCSHIIKDEMRELGLFATLPRIKEQFAACREAYDELQRNPQKRKRYCTNENLCDTLYCLDASGCSTGTDSCELPSINCDSGSDCGDISCCDLG